MHVPNRHAVASQAVKNSIEEKKWYHILKLYHIVVMPSAKARARPACMSQQPAVVMSYQNPGNSFPAVLHHPSVSRRSREALVRQLVPHSRVVRRHTVHLVHLEVRRDLVVPLHAAVGIQERMRDCGFCDVHGLRRHARVDGEV